VEDHLKLLLECHQPIRRLQKRRKKPGESGEEQGEDGKELGESEEGPLKDAQAPGVGEEELPEGGEVALTISA
jgi:hypothetical protein